MDLKAMIEEKMPLTLGEIIEIADEKKIRFVDVVLAEAEIQTGKSKEEVLEEVLKEFDHNLHAIEVGLTTGSSLLLGTTGSELNNMEGFRLFQDEFVDKALVYTIAAQVGNHGVGLNPCAGTGDSCPYTGFIKAMFDTGYERERVAEIAAMILKIGAMFRVGKTTTGCNMEGYGAGSAAIAAAQVELLGGGPRDIERAMVIAISPTIGVPCTPRVMVPALCATHIGGAILNGTLSAGLAVKTNIEVNVPIDVMLAMAAEIHPVAAKALVPTVVEFMQPFFKTKEPVERLIAQAIKDEEKAHIDNTLVKAKEVAKKLAKGARPITNTLGEAVVGGSSQAVGSPTNTGRIAHYLAKGKIKKVKIELYPELFARRGINVPGVLMGAVYGASTADGKMYKEVMELVEKEGIQVEIIKDEEYQVQRVTIETDEGTFMVDALNRGGGRLVLRDATPSKEDAVQIANKLGIVLVEA
ncbi:2-hydroxymethylglutarate dehydratase [Proteiniborus ethanoligenes]|uniref:2-hydroxymethylglutarate dehydratase n=2 Tax=Proteiniborus ethanoligenes TaxID=415015 RepID=A0A1H3SNH0_9FIRM|nr:2-hydroxymethylglutarate dehydratase [Proteiniborus ethanoligenes]